MTIDDKLTMETAVAGLSKGDLVRIKWKPVIRLYGRDTFIGKYVEHDPKQKTLTVSKDAFDMCDIKIEITREIPYARIEQIERLEPKKLY